jgi:serine/threonine protein kinase
MASNRWNRIEEIFQGALERPASERCRYIAISCGDDQELRLEVESLLASDKGADTALRSLVETDVRQFAPTGSEIGLQLGPYHLVRELDSGGMGVVYLAVRSDDQYFQIVAIKMVRRGLEWPSLVQRFRTERQILATLTHPNIGAILDGGETDDGRPFIVMEYVEGEPITLASESRGLTTRQRVELFRSVCSAVHYAHQKLVIHRDIKPSNVLVTPERIVKLIDFGVSKPLVPEIIPGEPPKTESGERLLTPDYASPEQLQGKELTTASDIYSLGVLLYELLTGSRPYTLEGLSPASAERLVCEEEVRRPSAVPGLADRIRKAVAGDLDTIICKAMERDPSRRYSSARHLEEDLLRFLRGRPILAREPTPLYRLTKFIKRHRTACLMACATVVVLAASIFVYRWQSRAADRKVKQVAALADSAISDMTEKLQLSSASVETQAAISQSALQFLNQLRQSSGDDPRLLLELSKAYERTGDVQGSPFVSNLGNSGMAVTSYEEALHTATEAYRLMPGAESTVALIEAYQKLADMETFLGNMEEGHENYQKSLSLALPFWQAKPDDPVRRRVLAMTYAGLGDVELGKLEPDKALIDYRDSFRIFGSDPTGEEEHDRTLTKLYLRLGKALNELGFQSEALANDRHAIMLAEGLVQQFPDSKQAKRDLFSAYQNIGLVLAGREAMNVGDSTQAQLYAHKALAIAESLAVGDPKNVQAQYDVSLAYAAMGDSFRLVQPAVAGGWYRKSISLTKQLAPSYGAEARHWIAIRDEALADVLVERGQDPERLQLLLESNPIRQELANTSPHGRIHLMRSYCKLSDAELAVGDVSRAREFAGSAVPFLNEFQMASPSLLVLRDVGFCDESIGNLKRRMAMDHSLSAEERQTAAADAHQWYAKGVEVWAEWNRRGVSTPESEAERRKVERLLKAEANTSASRVMAVVSGMGQVGVASA